MLQRWAWTSEYAKIAIILCSAKAISLASCRTNHRTNAHMKIWSNLKEVFDYYSLDSRNCSWHCKTLKTHRRHSNWRMQQKFESA